MKLIVADQSLVLPTLARMHVVKNGLKSPLIPFPESQVFLHP